MPARRGLWCGSIPTVSGLRVAARVVVLVGAALALQLLAASSAKASCRRVVLVDGHLLGGIDLSPAAAAVLPARGRSREAVVPACNDSGQHDPDSATRVQPLRGLPATSAVVEAGEGQLYAYVADGSLTGIATHPLHRAFAVRYQRRSKTPRCRRSISRFRGILDRDASSSGLFVRDAGRTRRLVVTEESRLLGWPVWTLLLKGQQVSVTASVCGSQRQAGAIRTVGQLVEPHLASARPNEGGGSVGDRGGVALWGLIALVAIATVVAGWRASRPE